MTNEDHHELVRGGGNVFRELELPNAGLEQLRARLAARIIQALDKRRLTVRGAQEVTGIAAADFSRIRRANTGRFTVDRLMIILARLGEDVDVTLTDRLQVDGPLPISESWVQTMERVSSADPEAVPEPE